MRPRPSPLARAACFVSSTFVLFGCVSTDPVGDGSVGNGQGGAPDFGTGPGGEGAASSVGQGGSSVGGAQVVCGDDVCDLEERCDLCPGDCGECTSNLVCGDGSCDVPDEDCDSCEADCGPCSMPDPVCGDGTCEASEDCGTCFQDCGSCPCVPDAFEPNGGSPSATLVSRGVDYCDLSICSDDYDWLEFSTPGGFTIALEFFNAQGDIELEVFSEATGDYVTGSYSALDGELVDLPTASAGTYWARIYGGNIAENPAYCFRVD